jgi:hypothetical protein
MAVTGKSASEMTRKRGLVQRTEDSPKPPAKTARKTPRSARSASKGRFKSGWEKNVADRWVIHYRLIERLPWSEIVERDGRSERALRAVVNDYLEHVQEGDAVRPLEHDPVELVESMLSELIVMRDTMVGLVRSSDNDRVVVAAMREWRRLARDVRELMQAAGVLPREFGTMRFTLEVREAAELLGGLLDGLEDQSVTPQEVRAKVAEWSGLKALPPGAPVDAEVVAACSGWATTCGC